MLILRTRIRSLRINYIRRHKDDEVLVGALYISDLLKVQYTLRHIYLYLLRPFQHSTESK